MTASVCHKVKQQVLVAFSESGNCIYAEILCRVHKCICKGVCELNRKLITELWESEIRLDSFGLTEISAWKHIEQLSCELKF